MKKPLVSIVIPSYNSRDFIIEAIESVLKTDYPSFEIVIIDDHSTDGSYELIKEHFLGSPKIRIYRNKKRLLAAGARNRGVRLSRGKYIALLDHDIEVDPAWIREGIRVFKNHKNVGVVQGKVLDMSKRNIIQHAGIKINSYLGWVISIGFGQKDQPKYNKEIEVFADATGLIFKKEIWRRIGGFDEKLAINVDDWDFNWRVWLWGYKEMLAPNSITYHWSKTQKKRDYWLNRVRWEFHFGKVPRLFIKNYELNNLLRFLPVYLFVNFVRGIFNLFLRLNPAPLLAFLWALAWNLWMLPDTLRERGRIQKARKISDAYLLGHIMSNEFIFLYFRKYWLPTIKLGKLLATESPKNP